MSKRIVYGQTWVSGDKLIQEQYTITDDGRQPTFATVDLIDNIWDDLMTGTGHKYKSNSRNNYFYWEANTTDPEDGESLIKLMINCPKPKDGLFDDYVSLDEVESKGEWAKYWLGKILEVRERSKDLTIQPREVVFPGTEYFDEKTQTFKTFEKRVVKNNDQGDIFNLLSVL